MKLRDPRLWLTALSLLVVALLVFLDSTRTSPGPLSATHAQLPELISSEGCVRCHGDSGLLAGGLSAACLDCHAQIDMQLREGAGLHGALDQAAVRDCAACHAEHLGADLDLAGPRAFTRAGLERESFAHGHVEFGLTGSHSRAGCVACHARADAVVLPPGESRFLGLDQACESCHDDPHAGAFERGCVTCHGQTEPFAALASFEHGDGFPLVGAHAGPTCAECHEPGGPRAIEVVAGPGPVPPARACSACHDDPHLADLIEAGETCALCHAADGGAFSSPVASAVLEQSPELHARAGFDLAPPHERASCGTCHGADSGAQFRARYPGRAARDCAACHDDPHAAQFPQRAGCNECHPLGQAFSPSAFGVVEHAGTALPLEDSHAELACVACHAARATGPVLFADTPAGCADCHADAHPASFAQATQGCATCHVPSSFADVHAADFDHATWTGFELDGAHARAECAACHPATPRADAAGRSFGRAREVFGDRVPACSACHEDVHAGAFGADADCAECHSTTGFRDVPRSAFDHGARTPLALVGAHARAECVACHGSGSGGRRFGLVAARFPGPVQRCETCHADPHAGEFDQPGRPRIVDQREGCARCHGTATFATPAPGFDHGVWTGYELAGAHARAQCTDCHARLLEPDARGRHLAPAPGRGCASCHADPHLGQLARVECAQCHRSQERFDALEFEHALDTRFVLDAAHRDLACAACHVPWPLPDGREVVRYRPLGTRCIDCHDHGGPHGEGR